MNKPYGGDTLVNRVVTDPSEFERLKGEAGALKKITVADRFLSDCEMIAIGGFSPITGFMTRNEVDAVVQEMTLPNGLPWGIPIVLLVEDSQASAVKDGDQVALVDDAQNIVAIMRVTEKYRYPKEKFCQAVFKTLDAVHPGVQVIQNSPEIFFAGSVTLLRRPKREGITPTYYLDPKDTRAEFDRRGWRTIVAFQTRNPIHRAHEYLIKCALESLDGVLIHPIVGETKPDDIPAGVRMTCYKTLIKNYFNPERVVLSVLPTFMRYAGPREAVNHAIIRKNYGCTHFIIGRDHAGVGNYYGTYEAQELLDTVADKIGIFPIKFEHSFYCEICQGVASTKTCGHAKEHHLFLSGTKVREMLEKGDPPPVEFSRKEVVDALITWATQSDTANRSRR